MADFENDTAHLRLKGLDYHMMQIDKFLTEWTQQAERCDFRTQNGHIIQILMNIIDKLISVAVEVDAEGMRVHNAGIR